jgi:hypothetical protein
MREWKLQKNAGWQVSKSGEVGVTIYSHEGWRFSQYHIINSRRIPVSMINREEFQGVVGTARQGSLIRCLISHVTFIAEP